MRVKISTRLSAAPGRVFEKLQQPALLVEIASPICIIEPVKPDHLPERWHVDREYTFRMTLFKVLPIGRHTIRLVEIDTLNYRISSNESGKMVRVWNHLITLEEESDGSTTYTDDVEIEAGIRTPLIWLFAQLFYRHRQRKWRKIAGSL